MPTHSDLDTLIIYAAQLMVLLAAMLGILLLAYAILWISTRLYRHAQGAGFLLAAVRHFWQAHPETAAHLKLLAKCGIMAWAPTKPLFKECRDRGTDGFDIPTNPDPKQPPASTPQP